MTAADNPAGSAPIAGAAADPTLRVLSVIPGESTGVSMVFARRQIASLRALGVENHEFYLSSRTHPLRLFREAIRLRTEIARVRPQIVHAHYGTVTALLCSLSAPVPLVITFRGSDLNPSPHVGRFRALTGKFLSQLAALRATKIVCVSSRLRECLWWRRSCVVIVPTGVDNHLFHPRDRSACRAQLGWSDAERVVVFNAGKNARVKRLDLAQAAVDAARAACDNIRFVVMEGSVPPEQVPVLFGAADCLLLTSDYEGSPNVVKEALACNLPVVSVNVGDVEEQLAGVTPSAIARRDVAELSRELLNILLNPERSDGSKKMINLSQANIARKLLSVYLSCRS